MSNWSLQIDADQVAWLTCDMAEGSANVLSGDMVRELSARLTEIAALRPRGMVVQSGKASGFIAGADIKEFIKIRTPAEGYELVRAGQAVMQQLEELPCPTVAAIRGFALGGGLELAMCCTVRIAAHDAKLGQPEVKLGVLAGYGGTQRLPRLVGRGRALDMLLSGEPVSAAEAHRMGLVNHVVEKGELIPFSRAWLAKVLANGPLAVGLTMQAVDAGLDLGIDAGLRFEAMAFGLAAASGDRAEGTRAFLEKRAPVFTGK